MGSSSSSAAAHAERRSTKVKPVIKSKRTRRSLDEDITLPYELSDSPSSGEVWEHDLPAGNVSKYDLQLYRESAILIFDLDDTLIPTEWIRSSFSTLRCCYDAPSDIYQIILDEIHVRTKGQLIPVITRILKKAKERSATVAIVTNARSIRWLTAFRTLFPEIVKVLDEEGIPIIRSCPAGEEPNISNSSEYFFYWMNAKKIKFTELIRVHKEKSSCGNSVPLDLISIGDNDFEEHAALRIAEEGIEDIHMAKVVRCRPGLPPELFLNQLRDIDIALDHVYAVRTVCPQTQVGPSVSYKIQGNQC